MASDAEFEEQGIEPSDGDDHERADGGGDVEVEHRGVVAEEWEIITELIESVPESEHESDIGDIVGDGIEPFAAMARTHAHASEFAVDAVYHRRELPEDDGDEHGAWVTGGDEGGGGKSDDEPESRDHVRGDGGVGDSLADLQRAWAIDEIGD